MVATHPANTPPASTRKILITIWNQNSAEKGSGTSIFFFNVVAETAALMASLTNGTPSTPRMYDNRREVRIIRIRGRRGLSSGPRLTPTAI